MLKYYAVSHPGNICEVNEDSFFAGDKAEEVSGLTLKDSLDMAVCDGMGGEMYGDQASQAAIVVIKDFCARVSGEKALDEECIKEACNNANDIVCEMMRLNKVRMGSTLALIRFYGRKMVLANLGDSRIYRLRDNMLEQLSVDHTTVARLIKEGLITTKEAKTHPSAHQITQYLGIFAEEMILEPHILVDEIKRGDIYLLCSDGLTDMVDDETIETMLKEGKKLDKLGKKLLETALHNGGRDNITLALAEVVI